MIALWCTLVLLLLLTGLSLLIVRGKALLSVFVTQDISLYVVLIVGLIVTFWLMTWFYMASIPADTASITDNR